MLWVAYGQKCCAVFDIITCVNVITFAKYQEKNMGNAFTEV